MSSAQRSSTEESGMELSTQEIFKDRLFEPDEDPATFRNTLVGLADTYGEEEYYKAFSKEQLAKFEKVVVDSTIEIMTLDKEKKEIVKTFDEQLKPLKENRDKLAMEIKAGHTWVKEVVYKVFDETSGMVAVYDSLGVLQSIEKLKRGRGLQKTIALKS